MQRVRLIAAAKNIRTEEINVHLKVKPEWFLTKISSYGQVPVIEHEGRVIRESIIAFGEFLTYFRVLNNCAKDEFKSQPLIPLVGRPSPVDYVDEVFPGKSLWPTDPYQKALDRLLLNDFGNQVCYTSSMLCYVPAACTCIWLCLITLNSLHLGSRVFSLNKVVTVRSYIFKP